MVDSTGSGEGWRASSVHSWSRGRDERGSRDASGTPKSRRWEEPELSRSLKLRGTSHRRTDFKKEMSRIKLPSPETVSSIRCMSATPGTLALRTPALRIRGAPDQRSPAPPQASPRARSLGGQGRRPPFQAPVSLVHAPSCLSSERAATGEPLFGGPRAARPQLGQAGWTAM